MKKNRTIYCVTSGCYSDYRIVAMFSTLDLALAAKALTEDANEVEEYILDEHAENVRRGELMYLVWMDREGRAEYPSQFPYYWKPEKFHISDDKMMCKFLGYAKSEEHAVKICNEKRVQAIASGEM